MLQMTNNSGLSIGISEGVRNAHIRVPLQSILCAKIDSSLVLVRALNVQMCGQLNSVI